MLNFVEIIEKIVGIKAKKKFVKHQIGDVKSTWSDISLIKSILGYTKNQFRRWNKRIYYGIDIITKFKNMKIVLTGGLGFIGSHAAVMLANTNHEIIILDNLSNSNILTLDKINKLTKKKVKFFQCDLVDYINLNCIRNINGVDAIVHFAGLKSVSESQKPYDYYKNNFISSMNIVRFMNEKKN